MRFQNNKLYYAIHDEERKEGAFKDIIFDQGAFLLRRAMIYMIPNFNIYGYIYVYICIYRVKKGNKMVEFPKETLKKKKKPR